MPQKATTTAYVKVNSQDFYSQCIDGEVAAGQYNWHFIWEFGRGELQIEPPLGRALIKDALLRFLIKTDYNLEPGEDYNFTVKARF